MAAELSGGSRGLSWSPDAQLPDGRRDDDGKRDHSGDVRCSGAFGAGLEATVGGRRPAGPALKRLQKLAVGEALGLSTQPAAPLARQERQYAAAARPLDSDAMRRRSGAPLQTVELRR
jgi:hypothetical protein